MILVAAIGLADDRPLSSRPLIKFHILSHAAVFAAQWGSVVLPLQTTWTKWLASLPELMDLSVLGHGAASQCSRKPSSLRMEPLENRTLMSVTPMGVEKFSYSDDDFVPVGMPGDQQVECMPVDFVPVDFVPVDAQPVDSRESGVFSGDDYMQTAVFDFSFEGVPVLTTADGATTVSLAGEELWLSTGDPMVPVRETTILLPQNTHIASIDVTYRGEGTIIGRGVGTLASPVAVPTDGSLPMSSGWEEFAGVSFPTEEAADYSNVNIAGYNLGILRVFPVAYDAAADTLTYYSDIVVSVTTTAIEGVGNLVARASQTDYDRVAAMVDNPEAMQDYAMASAGDVAVASGSLPESGSYDYVIITSSALEASFQPLIQQKQDRGISARTVTTEYITANYSGTENGDKADKIRDFIRDAYGNWGTEYVLLGGDVEIIPKRGVYVAVGSYVDSSLPTDLYYSCLDGTWNGDGDSRWGEYNDGNGGGDIDLAADVYIGRAPVSNATEAYNFVSKTVNYETTAHPNYDTAVWLGEKLDDNTYGSYSSIPIKNATLPGDWNVIERYDSTGGWSGSTFRNDLNNSPHIINHLGHANETYNARLGVSTVAALTNDNPYFMYSQGCMSGSFDTHDRSIAEMHVVDDHGAFAVVMNSRYGWYQPGSSPSASHWYAMEFWDAVFNEGKTGLGQANQDSHDDNMWRVGSNGVYRWINFETNLLGDPETSFQLDGQPFNPGNRIEGGAWLDADADGSWDGTEEVLAGATVYIDANNNGALDTATANFNATGLPISLVDNGTATSNMTVSGTTGTITDINVTLDISHTYNWDLTVNLISPTGTKIELFSNIGSSGDNFTGTTLDDEAGTDIADGSAPFSGTFRPFDSLSLFDGQDANGTWTLEVIDEWATDTGTLNSWSLEITSGETITTTDANGEFRFSGLDDGEYYIRAEVPSGWTQTFPGDGYVYANMTGNTLVDNAYFGLAENIPPELDPIGDKVMSHTQDKLDIDLVTNDGDGDSMTLSAEAFTVEELAYQLDQELGLYSARDDDFHNARGQGEKYLPGADSEWYYMLSGGELYHWKGSFGDSEPIATLGSRYYEDTSLLWNAQVPAESISGSVTVSLSGNTLTIDPAADFMGEFFVRASVSDGYDTTSEVFAVEVTNSAPQLQSIDNETISHNQNTVDVTLVSSDDDGDTVSYSAEVFATEELAYQLDQECGFHSARDDHYFNARGYSEKYICGTDSNWYFLRTGGELYRWNGSIAGSPLVATLGDAYYNDPSMLFNVPAPAASIAGQVSLGLSGSTLTIDPAADYLGDFQVKVTADDGLETTFQTFVVSVTNDAPQLQAIADKTISHSQDTLDVALVATDADGDTPGYSVEMFSTEELAYQLDQECGFFSVRDDYYLNARGYGEKYITGTDSNWYFLRTGGELYRWNGSIGGSTLLATLGDAYYSDPSLLFNVAEPVAAIADHVTLGLSGSTLTVDPAADYLGTFHVRVTANDGITTDFETFSVSVTNDAPELENVADQTFSHSEGTWDVTLVTNDDDGDSLNISAEVFTVEELAYQLDQQLGLHSVRADYYVNARGQGEKYLRGAGDNWYFLLSGGELYHWNDSIAGSSLVATLGAEYYHDPSLLHDAQPVPAALAGDVSVSVSGNTLTIDPAADYTGRFFVRANVSDGLTTITKTFAASVTNEAPQLQAIDDQTMAADDDTLDINLITSDADGDTPNIAAEAFSADQLAYELDQEFGLHSVRADNYFNARGYGEKYLPGTDSNWYFLLAGGKLYRWDGSIEGSTLLATLGSKFYDDPSLLWNAQAPAESISEQVTVSLSGSTLTIDPADGYAGDFFVRVTVSDGIASTSQTFAVSVAAPAGPLHAIDALLADESLGEGTRPVEDDVFWSESTPESEVLDEVYQLLEDIREVNSLRSLF